MSDLTGERDAEMYSEEVPVLLKHAEREDKPTHLTVALSYTVGQPRNQQVLHVRLTDESDPYLLYTLNISEDDFHALKSEQSILVDFSTFPSKLIELLRHCQTAASEEHPRFVAHVSTLTGIPVFTITETNPFRQLAHLALRFVAGNDASIKKYLASRLIDFKARLANTVDELTHRSAKLQETEALASQQRDRLRLIEEEHERHVSALKVQQSGELAEAKERALNAQQEANQKHEQDRARIVQQHDAGMTEMRTAHAANEARIAKLTAASHELQLQLRERSNRLESLEQEATLLRQQNKVLREENSSLTTTTHSLEKKASARDVELSASTQALRDKDELLARTSSLLDAAEASKRQKDETLEMYKDNCLKLQDKLKASAAEITKGNQIIGQLQADVRAQRAKLRLKAAMILQHQEQATTKQQAIESSERTSSELRAQIAELNASKERSEESLASSRQQLAEAQELLRSNQQVIQWLNKELNDAQSGQHLRKTGPTMLTQPLKPTSFRPSLPVATPSDATGELFASSSSGTGGDSIHMASNSCHAASSKSGWNSATPNLRSRAGLAFMDSSRVATEKPSGVSDFSKYLNPSSAVH